MEVSLSFEKEGIFPKRKTTNILQHNNNRFVGKVILFFIE